MSKQQMPTWATVLITVLVFLVVAVSGLVAAYMQGWINIDRNYPEAVIPQPQNQQVVYDALPPGDLGMGCVYVPYDYGESMGLDYGFLVTRIILDGPTYKAGIREGDTITFLGHADAFHNNGQNVLDVYNALVEGELVEMGYLSGSSSDHKSMEIVVGPLTGLAWSNSRADLEAQFPPP